MTLIIGIDKLNWNGSTLVQPKFNAPMISSDKKQPELHRSTTHLVHLDGGQRQDMHVLVLGGRGHHLMPVQLTRPG